MIFFSSFLYLLCHRIRVSKVLSKNLIGHIVQKRFFEQPIHGGNETSKLWKPLLNTIFALRRLVGTVRVSV